MVCISWFTGSSVLPVVQSWSTQYHKVHSTMQLGRLGMREFSNQLCPVHDKRIHELPSVKVLHCTTLAGVVGLRLASFPGPLWVWE